tara:strand:- start:1790 stop:1984 length:195 start_codon:yes stop_codon:yes gene_type:complete
MIPHYCKVEKSHMMISGCCNWCGEREPERFVVITDRLAWVTWAVVAIVFVGCAVAISFFLGKLI